MKYSTSTGCYSCIFGDRQHDSAGGWAVFCRLEKKVVSEGLAGENHRWRYAACPLPVTVVADDFE